jgi:hypothetical protein
MEDVYFCSQFYSWETETFVPIEIDDLTYSLVHKVESIESQCVADMLLTELQLRQAELQLIVLTLQNNKL